MTSGETIRVGKIAMEDLNDAWYTTLKEVTSESSPFRGLEGGPFRIHARFMALVVRRIGVMKKESSKGKGKEKMQEESSVVQDGIL